MCRQADCRLKFTSSSSTLPSYLRETIIKMCLPVHKSCHQEEPPSSLRSSFCLSWAGRRTDWSIRQLVCTSVCEQPFFLRRKCELLLVAHVVSVAVSCNLEARDCEEPVDLVLSHPRERKAEWVELSLKGLSITPRSASYWSLLLMGCGL